MASETPKTKKCKYCGREISSDTPFCWYCGRELETRPERPSEESRGGAPVWLFFLVLAVIVIVVGILIASNWV